jgi:eukaryotic-like serine/threonine-protein kinase
MIAAGSTLLHYRIVEKIGEGGMGAVWRATDATLDRDVAIKVLPVDFASDTDRLARFEREAKVLASLNHPHIGAIYGFHEVGGVRFLAMELVPGDDLAKHLEKGSVPSSEAVDIARQIAEALEYAHERGIVHRDLKPANVKITPDGAVKVLDFGLAKAVIGEGSASGSTSTPTILPTMTSAGTAVGMILGTAAYMSPEQARGKTVDKRADIWAFGVVLFEMLAGRRPFDGETVSDTIAAVLTRPIELDALPRSVPASIRRLLARCLERDPKARLRDIGEARIALASPASASAEPDASVAVAAPRRPAWMVATAAIALVAAGAALALIATRPRAAVLKGALSRFSIGSSENATLKGDGVDARISPDGRLLAFLAASPTGTVSFWVRPLDSLTAKPLAGTEDGLLPFWSPDSRYLGYFGNGKLWKTLVTGGAPEAICDVGDGRGATWGRGGMIVLAPQTAGPLYRVSERGGELVPVTELDASRKETGHRWPSFLPDGKHFLFVTLPAKQGNFDVFMGSIDSKERRFLFTASGAPFYAEPGYLIYVRDNTLVAHRFDVKTLTTTGEPVSLGEAPAPSFWSGSPVVSASNEGTLARWGQGLPNTVLQWYDRTGKPAGDIPVPPGRYEQVRLSSNGKRLAVVRRSSVSSADIWLVDLDRPVPSRFTFGPATNFWPTWSPDDSRIAFGSDRSGPYDMFVKSTNGATAETAVLEGGSLFKLPSSWSADGKSVVFYQPDPKTGWDIGLLPLDGKGKAVPLLHTPAAETSGSVSPDGRWIAYDSDEGGRSELFVQSFPGLGAKYQVSSGGAGNTTGLSAPCWARGGKELMFLAGDGVTVMAVDVTTGASFHAGAPRELFKLRPDIVSVDMTPDGERILSLAPAGQPQGASVTLDINWWGQVPVPVP